MTRKIERTLKHAQFMARHIHGDLSSVVVAILIVGIIAFLIARNREPEDLE